MPLAALHHRIEAPRIAPREIVPDRGKRRQAERRQEKSSQPHRTHSSIQDRPALRVCDATVDGSRKLLPYGTESYYCPRTALLSASSPAYSGGGRTVR